MGIDYGSSNIGISLSDPLKIIANDYVTIHNISDKKSIKKIGEICKNKNVELIIVGIPIGLNGKKGMQAKIVQKFSKKLEKIGIQIRYLDERLTTKIAENTLKELNYSNNKIKEKSDVKAASVILQNFLDFN